MTCDLRRRGSLLTDASSNPKPLSRADSAQKSVALECRSRAALRFGDFVAESLVTLAPDARMLGHGRIRIVYGYFPQEPSNRQVENGLTRSAPLRGVGLDLGNRRQQTWRKMSSKYQFPWKKGRHGIGLSGLKTKPFFSVKDCMSAWVCLSRNKGLPWTEVNRLKELSTLLVFAGGPTTPPAPCYKFRG